MRKALTTCMLLGALLALPGIQTLGSAVEAKQYRLLSITSTSKMILISDINTKQKYVLDASTAKITVDNKPTEFEDLKEFTLIRVKFNPGKGSKDGIDINGVATEISISTPAIQK